MSKALEQHTPSFDVGCGIPSLPLDCTHRRTMSRVACHHPLKKTYTVGRGRIGMPSWNFDSANNQKWSAVACHYRSRKTHTIGWHWARATIIALGQYTRSDAIGRCMPWWPLDSTHGRTMSSMDCPRSHLITHIVEQRQVWQAIIPFGDRTQSDYVGRGMPSSLLERTHDRT